MSRGLLSLVVALTLLFLVGVAFAIIGFCHGMHAGTRPAWTNQHRH